MTSPPGLLPVVKETMWISPSNFQVTVSPALMRTFSGESARRFTVSWPAPACTVTVPGARLLATLLRPGPGLSPQVGQLAAPRALGPR
jgi:hypothetical protein